MIEFCFAGLHLYPFHIKEEKRLSWVTFLQLAMLRAEHFHTIWLIPTQRTLFTKCGENKPISSLSSCTTIHLYGKVIQCHECESN